MAKKSGWYNGGGLYDTRLDVDGDYPQNVVSFRYNGSPGYHMIGNLSSTGTNLWECNAVTTVSGTSNGITRITLQYYVGSSGEDRLTLEAFNAQGTKLVRLGGIPKKSDHFRLVEVEYDYEAGVNAGAVASTVVGAVNHTVQTVYQRAGVGITVNGSGNSIASASAGADALWTTAELHDAMQVHWSRPDGTPWAMWVMFAKKSNEARLLGRMFDSSDADQRNGLAIFSDAHAGLANEDQYLFQTTVHEMGHAFNLLHSWEKTFDPWRAGVVNEPGAASFMNYPWKYTEFLYGHQDYSVFFNEFQYRFSDQEIVFLRHAPDEWVSMGQSAFASNNSSQLPDLDQSQAGSAGAPVPLSLEIRVNKAQPVYQFLEPVHVELKLKNVGAAPVSVPARLLDEVGHMALWIRRNEAPAARYAPFDHPCFVPDKVELQPGESLYGSVLLSAGRDGWLIHEPGKYAVSLVLDVGDGRFAASNELTLAVRAPGRARLRELDRAAQDYFSDGVGRALAYGGTKTLTDANDTLRDLAARFPALAAARHAEITVAMPSTRAYKLLDVGADGKRSVQTHKVDPKAVEAARKVLVDKGAEVAETLGHIPFQRMSSRLADGMAASGDASGAEAVQRSFEATLQRRGVKLPANVAKRIAEERASRGKKR